MIFSNRKVLDLSVPIDESKVKRYEKTDLKSVYVHYDTKLARNIPTPNKLKEVNANE